MKLNSIKIEVVVDESLNDRDFRRELKGTMIWADEEEGIGLLRPDHVFVYHPKHRKNGSFLPFNRYGMIAINLSDIIFPQ